MPNNFTKVDWSRGVNLVDAPNMLTDTEVQRTRNFFPYGPRGLLSTRPNANYASLLGSSEVSQGNYVMDSATLPMSQGFITLYAPTQFSGDLSYQSFSYVDTTSNPDGIYLGARGDGSFTAGGATVPYFGAWRQGPLTQMPICVNYMNEQLWFSSQRTLSTARTESYAKLAFVPYVPGPGGGFAAFSYAALAGLNNSDIRPAGACTYRERLVMWNLKAGYEDCLLFTDNNNLVVGDDALAANGRYVQIGNDGIPVVSCVRVQLENAGSQSAEGLLVLKASGAYLLTSEPNQSWETTEPRGNPRIQIIRFNVEASCLSHHTVVQTPYGIVWCGVDDVWAFVIGQLPFRIGTKLNPAIRASALGGYGWRANAAFYAGRYMLALPTLAYNVGSTSIYDGFEQYWLELRNGMPPSYGDASWYGPQVYGSGYWQGALGAETRIEKPGYVYLTSMNSYQSSGTKYGIMSAQLDANRSGQDVLASQVPLYLRTDSFPLAELRTKDYDFGDAMTDKVYTGTEISLKTANNLPLSIKSSMNGDLDQSVATDLLLKNSANSYVTSLAYPGDDAPRPIGTDISIEMYQLNGFVVIDGVNDHVHFLEESGQSKQAKITAGRYSTLDSLLDAICAAMTQKSHNSRTYTHNQNSFPRTNQYVTITASGGTWAFVNQLTDPISVALLALIGFTQAQGSYTPAISQTAATEVAWAPAYPFDLDSVILRTFTIPRRPAV